jgi:hypothetical protein
VVSTDLAVMSGLCREVGEAAHPNRSQDQPGDVRRVPVHRLDLVSLDDLLVIIYVSDY